MNNKQKYLIVHNDDLEKIKYGMIVEINEYYYNKIKLILRGDDENFWNIKKYKEVKSHPQYRFLGEFIAPDSRAFDTLADFENIFYMARGLEKK